MKYSWFYIDVVTPDGLILVIVFYGRPFFLSFDISLLDISVYHDGEKSHFGFTQPLAESHFQTKPVEVEISGGRLTERADRFFVALNKQEISLDLVLAPLFQNVSCPSTPLFKSNNEYFNWKVFLPKAIVSGSLEMNGRKIKINGEGYLDFNEGNFPLNKRLKKWYWGRIYSPENAVIWGSLLFNDGSLVQPLLKASHAGVNLKMSDVWFRDENGAIEIPGESGKLKLHENLQFDRVPFLISRLPENWKFFRKIHEFVFYRLDESRWGRKLSHPLANVHYERSRITMKGEQDKNYSGLLEYIRFD